MRHMEIQRGKEGMKTQKFNSDVGATAGCTLRLLLNTIPLIQAATKYIDNIILRPPTTNINTTLNTDNTLFIHWRHHPNDISKKTIQTIYNNTLQGKDTFNHMCIATSRPKNL